MSGRKTEVVQTEPSTTADHLIAAFHCAYDLGDMVIANRLLAILEDLLDRRKADGHKEVEKLFVEIAIAKEALSKAIAAPRPAR
jgi:hypothetical protein